MTRPLEPPDAPAAAPRRVLDRVSVLRYANVENTPTYRAIVEVFASAKARYRIELRPSEVLEALRRGPFEVDERDEASLERDLEQLAEWGNLGRAHDTEAVSRIEDYYRKRFIYHLTSLGEAAHQAVAELERTVGKSGSLQTAMLRRVDEALRTLRSSGDDAQTLLRAFQDLFTAFESLTAEATRFIGDLGQEVGSARADEERYLVYKQAVLQYITRFVEELRRVTPPIGESLRALDDAAVRAALQVASQVADLPPRPDGSDPAEAWVASRLADWRGVRHWFVGAPGDEAVVERLRQVTVRSVLQLTRTLGRLNEQRGARIDRAADFRSLARWFSSCDTDEGAHALASAAFGLSSSRHMHLAEVDDELVRPGTSWWEAPPVAVPVRLRTRGSISRAGRTPAARDFKDHKLWLRHVRQRERAQLEEVRKRFVGQPFHVGELERLGLEELDLFLELLDQALGAPRASDGSRSARTADGAFEVHLSPPPLGAPRWATLVTPRGRLRCLDYRVEVRRSGALAQGGGRLRLLAKGGEP